MDKKLGKIDFASYDRDVSSSSDDDTDSNMDDTDQILLQKEHKAFAKGVASEQTRKVCFVYICRTYVSNGDD